MTLNYEDLTRAFESGEIDKRSFGHRDHVAVAFGMLHRYDFMEAAARYAATIKSLATRAGAPEKYNTTITLAFLSLIAERMKGAPDEDYEAFIARNPDLLSKDILTRLYSPGRLRSDLARETFLLPDVLPHQQG